MSADKIVPSVQCMFSILVKELNWNGWRLWRYAASSQKQKTPNNNPAIEADRSKLSKRQLTPVMTQVHIPLWSPLIEKCNIWFWINSELARSDLRGQINVIKDSKTKTVHKLLFKMVLFQKFLIFFFKGWLHLVAFIFTIPRTLNFSVY